jgi:hypothetical protein
MLDPTALALSDTARLLAKVGAAAISEEMLQNDVQSGAPTNGDGTLNLVHYAAWLVKETSLGD